MESSLSSLGRLGATRQAWPDIATQADAGYRRKAAALSQPHPNGAAHHDPLVKALGWFSIGLGLTQLLAPRAIAKTTGIADYPTLLRALGIREIASGVGILSQRKPTGWLWSRVAGDGMDLALLAVAAGSSRRTIASRRNHAALATAAVVGVTILDVLSSVKHTGEDGLSGEPLNIEKSLTINRSADECYRFWRDIEKFPRFMKHLESVHVVSDRRSHWKAKTPIGTSVEWDAEIIDDEPGKFLAWRSVDGADVDNAGTIRFEPAPDGRGTIVRVELQYSPPGGKAGALIAKLFGENPSRQIDGDLRRFKQILETGEVTTTEGQSSGPRSTIVRLLKKGVPG